MKKITLGFCLILFVVLGCHTNVDTDTAPPGAPAFNGEGYRPIYSSQTEIRQVSTESPQALRKPGKIYVRGNYLFINEQGKGLHLIDNADPRAPRNLSFIKIPGNVDIAVKGNLLYADNGRDFVVLNIADANQPKEGVDQAMILRCVATLLFHFAATAFQRGFVCLKPPGG